MHQNLKTSLLAIVAFAPVVNVVCHAESLPPLTHHVQDVVLNGQAKSVGRLPATQSMRIVLVLPHQNEAALGSFLKDLYDPSSSSYRKFLTVEEFTSRFGPSQQDYDAVVSFAKTHGLAVVGTSVNRMNVDVTGPVAGIESALHVTMGLYQHPTENRTFYSPDREPTPDLSVRLWHIAGLDNYSIPQPALVHRSPGVQPMATTGSCPSASFCGSDMRAAYYGGTSLTGKGQSLGLLEYAGTDLADLKTYFTNAGQTNNVPITLKSTDGTSTSCLAADNCDDTEQTIDMTQALGMAPGMSSLVMYVGSSDAAIFNAMAMAKPLNAQLSSSWTWRPADPNTDNPYFEEFAAQGQNLFQAAGDSGAWHPSTSTYPSDDVYLTSVGGTDLDTVSAGGAWSSETVWANGGGGIGPDKFPIPSWQTAAAAGCTPCSQVYRNGPDVSANSNYSFYVCADQTTCTANDYGGTSFAAPMWAGYLALANELAVSKGGSPLGFINPAIYTIGLGSSYHADFHDITAGSNGYSATPGYDLGSGWGSPNGSALIVSLTAPPSPGFTIYASPGAVSVVHGGTIATTINSAVTDGFDSPVSLTASGQPTGVTVVFDPTSITGNGTSTMSISVASTVAKGTYVITVKGTAGAIVETTTVTLTVTLPVAPDFTISASPASITATKGSTKTSKITTTVIGGFDSAVALSASNEGTGITVTFSPATIAAPGAGTSTATIKVASGASSGAHKITVTGTGGGVTHATTITVDVIK
jgi:subtilase family serine protease